LKEIKIDRSVANDANSWILVTGRASVIGFLQKRGLLKKLTVPTETAKIRTIRNAVDYLAIGFATAGGAGFMPRAPGTAGAAVGVLVYLAIETLDLGRYYPHAIIFFFAAGVWASFRVEEFYGHDSQRIVIDEVVGQMIVFSFAAGRFRLPALDVIAGFGLFRLFDIFKPFPIRRLERLKGGVGVMADDVGAGIYALVILMILRYIFHR
jgi:phosphatidylglycerophosphatase A